MTSGTVTFTGIPDGTYTLYDEKLLGYANSSGPKVVTVVNGEGASTLTLVQNTGLLKVNLTLAAASAVGNVRMTLIKGTVIRTTPELTGSNQLQFSGLESGQYTLSTFDQSTNGSDVRNVWIVDGQTTLIPIDLSGGRYYAVSGTVRSVASPPNHTLSSINTNATALTIYTKSGTQSMSALRVEAYLVNPDNSIDALPTQSGMVWDPVKIKFGVVNAADGSYVVPNLREGSSYRLRLNTDFNADGVMEAPLEERTVTLIADKTGVDFTVRDGAKITGTLTAPEADNGTALTVTLTDADLKQVVSSLNVSLVGAEASFTFNNLRVGRYLVQVQDPATPAKYAAKPVFLSIESPSETRAVAISLIRGATVRCRFSKAGDVITSDNLTTRLPLGTALWLISRGQRVQATGPSATGEWIANVLSGTDYTFEFKPPQTMSEDAVGKRFLPYTTKITALGLGQVVDLGVIALLEGMSVSGTVKDEQGNALVSMPVLAYQSLARDLTPLKLVTDKNGSFTFEGLDTRIRFYDFLANPVGQSDSQTSWSQGAKNMVDITKPAQIANLNLVLKALNGGMRGTLLAASGQELLAAYGANEGRPGVSILVTNKMGRGNRIVEYISQPDGAFNLTLEQGLYNIEFLAKNHKLTSKTLTVTQDVVDFGSIQLVRAATLSGTIRNQDGSLPSEDQVAQLMALDTLKGVFRASLMTESVTESVDSYAFYGLAAGRYTLIAVDSLNRPRVLKENFDMPDQDISHDLMFTVTEPKLMASLMQKIPDGVEAIFSCNQAFRNNPDDADSDGTSDDNEFADFVSVVTGNGTLAFNSVETDRFSASYLYTKGDETGVNSLVLDAAFSTEEINPETGANFEAAGRYAYPFGLASSQEDSVSELGGYLCLPGGSGLNFPANAIALEGSSSNTLRASETGTSDVTVTFRAADSLNSLARSGQSSGRAAMRMAESLGPQYYPPRMYKAIKALSDAPEVNPFSSFYDIFLPLGVSHLFTNRPTLTMTYDEGADPSQINVYYFNEAQNVYTIENDGRSVDTNAHTISVLIGHASVFTVLSSSVPIVRGTGFDGTIDLFNFPNPFDLKPKAVSLQSTESGVSHRTINGTMIKMSVPVSLSGAVQIQIFNVAGEKVRTLRDTIATGGAHFYLEWDGENDGGEEVASGIYIARFTLDGKNEKFFKMAVVK